jgi:tetratricopeptide (TPR) repeat protein
VAEARRAAEEGDPSRAADLFLELVATRPDRIDWVLEATENLLAASRFSDALDLLDDAARRFPDRPEVPIRIARTHSLRAASMARQRPRDINVQFQLEEAARVAQRVLERWPKEREPRALLAHALLQLGRNEEAIGEAEELVRRFPRDQAGQVLLGDAHFAEHARYRAEAATATDPDEQERATTLSEAARAAAIEAYRMAAVLDDARPHPWVQLGRIAAWANDRDEALAAFGEALVRDPQSAVDHGWVHETLTPNERAEFYREVAAGYRARAGADATAAAAATLDWYRAYACYEAEKFADAYRLFDAAVAANPAYLNSRCYAMLAAYWNGDRESARLQAARYGAQAPKHFADTIRARPDADQVIAILEFLGRSSHEDGKLEQARDISSVLARLLDTERHWNDYAFLCRETGAYEESLAAYENALALDPESPWLLNDTAVVLQYHLPSPEHMARAEELYHHAIARADAILADPASDASTRADARAARENAEKNLAALPHR